MPESEASPRPWTVEVETEGEDGRLITIPEIHRCLHDWDWAETEDWERDLANADLIVQAVNSFDSLRAENAKMREACEAALTRLKDNQHWWESLPQLVNVVVPLHKVTFDARADYCGKGVTQLQAALKGVEHGKSTIDER